MSSTPWVIAQRLVALAWVLAPSLSAAAPASCPDIAGTYIVLGDEAIVDSALRVIGAGAAGGAGASLRVSGSAHSVLRLSLMRAKPERLSRPAQWTLSNPHDFRCENGWLVLNRPITAYRQVAAESFSGPVTARLAPALGGALQVELRFKGQRSLNLYSYDSAKVDLPLPWSRTAATDRLVWPEGAVAVYRPESVDLGDPDRAAAARQLLGSTGLKVGKVEVDEIAVRAQVAATTEELVQLEDKLRAAAVTYQVPESPTPSSAGAYFVSVLLPRQPSATSLPSHRWVERELRRCLYPGTSVDAVSCRDGLCTARLGLTNGARAEQSVERLMAMSKAFSDARLLPQSERPLSADLRQVDLQLRPR